MTSASHEDLGHPRSQPILLSANTSRLAPAIGLAAEGRLQPALRIAMREATNS
jgi:hypothetical protein